MIANQKPYIKDNSMNNIEIKFAAEYIQYNGDNLESLSKSGGLKGNDTTIDTTVKVTNTSDSTNTIGFLRNGNVLTMSLALDENLFASKIAILPRQSDAIEYDGSTKTVSLQNYNIDAVSYTGDTTGVNAGVYTLIFKPRTGYKWRDNTRGEKVVTWKIDKKQITIPSQSGTITYNGSNKTPSWNNPNSAYVIIDGATGAQKEVGTYNVTFTLKDTDNTEWTDGTTEVKNGSWTISPAK